MTQYYFDIETNGFDSEKDKIISIQYQELDGEGKSKGDLIILKEWESDEKTIVTKIHKKLISDYNWGFIPIGQNLIFDLTFLFKKFKKYDLPLKQTLSEYLYDKPLVDIKSSLIIANSLNFKGSGLDHMTNKQTDGRNIPSWHQNKEYSKIEDYITQETESFIEFFQKLMKKLKELKGV